MNFIFLSDISNQQGNTMAVTPMIFFLGTAPSFRFFQHLSNGLLMALPIDVFFSQHKIKKKLLLSLYDNSTSNINLYNIYYVRIYNYLAP